MAGIYQETREQLNRLRQYEQRRRDARNIAEYWLFFFGALVYWEIVTYLAVHHSLRGIRGWFLLFAASEAMIPAALSGWFIPRLNRIHTVVLTSILFVYYLAQLIYCRTFGSVFSVSMIGMGGEAIGNFGWSIRETLLGSIPWLLLLAVPLLASVLLLFLHTPRAEKYRHTFRPVLLLAAATAWLWSAALLRLGGTSDASAYHAYSSPYTDTDTAASKLGALTTSLVETRSIYFGGVGSEDDLNEILGNVASAQSVGNLLEGASAEDRMGSSSPETGDPESDEVSSFSSETEEEPETETVEAPAEPEEPEPEMLDTSPNILEAIDFEALAAIAPNSDVEALCEYFAGIEGTNRNEYTGMFEGYNLICICGEAFSNFAVSEEITPTLYRLAHEGIVLNNFYNSFPNTTTNGEFAFLTGLWPDVSRTADNGRSVGSFGQSASNYMPYGLGNELAQIGVTSYAYHNYYGSYYSRNLTHPNLGYLCTFVENMDIPIQWPSSDLAMFEQTVDDYIGDDQFHAYYMTFSGHGPYTNYHNYITSQHLDLVPDELDGRKLTQGARGFFSNQMELELALDYLLERLEGVGKLENTLIVLLGDHYSYYLSDTDVASIAGEVPEANFEKFHSTCILWSASIEEPIEVDIPCCNVDILPTILNLMGLEYDSRMLPGTDIFSDGLHVAILYNRSFITESVKYQASNGKTTWLTDVSDLSEELLKEYVDSISGIVKAKYATSLTVNSTNFYRFVWENSGLMTRAEIVADDAKSSVTEQEVQSRIAADEAKERAEAEAAAIRAAEEAAALAAQQAALAAEGVEEGTPEVPPETP